MESQSKQILSNINAVQQLPHVGVVGQFVEQEKHHVCATQHFLSIEIMSTVTETTNVHCATQNFREFEYTVQTVSATNLRR